MSYDPIDEIIAAAKHRDAASLEDTVSSLSEENRQIVAAQLGFVALHLLACNLAEKLVKNGYRAVIHRESALSFSIRLHTVHVVSQVDYISGPQVVIQYLGGSRRDWEHRWMPESLDVARIHAEAKSYAAEFARHLTNV